MRGSLRRRNMCNVYAERLFNVLLPSRLFQPPNLGHFTRYVTFAESFRNASKSIMNKLSDSIFASMTSLFGTRRKPRVIALGDGEDEELGLDKSPPADEKSKLVIKSHQCSSLTCGIWADG